jgi:hypothetical protein
MDRHTRYYVNQSGGVRIGPFYMASVRMQWVNGIKSYFRGLFHLLNLPFMPGHSLSEKMR